MGEDESPRKAAPVCHSRERETRRPWEGEEMEEVRKARGHHAGGHWAPPWNYLFYEHGAHLYLNTLGTTENALPSTYLLPYTQSSQIFFLALEAVNN